MSETVEVTVGVISRAHGVRGEVYVEPRTDEIKRRFTAGAQLRTNQGGTLTVQTVKQPSGRLVVSFREITDRTAAEQQRGCVLSAVVPADERPSGQEEYFDRQLTGLTVLRADGTASGTIKEIVHGPAQDLLVIDLNGSEYLVPFVKALVPDVDLDAGSVRLADVPGLLDDGAEEG
ncbi:MAG: ribosome maturation factor RimM [Propionibacteriaceae bacterium]|jgi:16S rRNA processing protein RimM|uniref:Ribosome maturation factor RimM n=1 Tax=Brooklawnia propionicigenes TaxID=3041175 RepID=A0AAN0KEE8_9ACTN|nr:ribosome maturation factor RimM [Brooklawnia sp. SH051]MCB0884374.1 ribosome maturation factor RimM [Propionibacteriaceae bacterium]MEA5120036.1 ribosome maturation factor RimM [Propionibacterium sp.]NLI83868.1 ribosome maturation factor RimM [Propionibacterium sp.]BEH01103.1 ribosome maturation factor RimM [Brooklawnia sp. SH051]